MKMMLNNKIEITTIANGYLLFIEETWGTIGGTLYFETWLELLEELSKRDPNKSRP